MFAVLPFNPALDKETFATLQEAVNHAIEHNINARIGEDNAVGIYILAMYESATLTVYP